MSNQEAINVFEDRKVRTLWDAEKETWYFSIVDVVAVLTESPNPRKYWSVLKLRLKNEGSELTTNCSQLKMTAAEAGCHNLLYSNASQYSRFLVGRSFMRRPIPKPAASQRSRLTPQQWEAQPASSD